MTWQQAVDEAVEQTGHTRYRWLCSDDNPDTEQREGYRRLMLERAGMPAPSPSPVPAATRPLDQTIVLLGRMRACPDRSERTDCGCAGLAMCAAGKGREGLVNHHDCLECLRVNP